MGEKVDLWDDVEIDETALAKHKAQQKAEAKQKRKGKDEWDKEYDKGKQKKVRKRKIVDFDRGKNRF